MPEPDIEIHPRPGEEVCDFCSGRPVKWRYPARPHTSGTIIAVGGRQPDMVVDFNSPDDWAACNACHSLISRGDRDGLAKYSVKKLIRKNPEQLRVMSKAEMTRAIRGVHDNFWKNREGAPEPHEVN